MNQQLMWPLIAQVGLTFSVWILMYRRRVREIKTRRIDVQKLTTSAAGSGVLQDVSASDNFRNLFEIPVLFYTLCAAAQATQAVSFSMVLLAWAFVVMRVAHTVVHVTYNRVMHRFFCYLISSLFVFAMWALFAWNLAVR